MTTWLGDLRYSVRSLLKQPGFSLIAILTLGIGIGANVAIFTIVNRMLLQPLPYANQARVLSLFERSLTYPEGMSVSLADFVDWRERQQVFDGMAVFQNVEFTLSGVEEPEKVVGTVTSTDLLAVLGVSPIHGRGFTEEEGKAGAERVALVGYGLWQRRFGGRPIVGEVIELDRRPYTVIGVMAEDFGFPEFSQVWVPLTISAAGASRGSHQYAAIGLLKIGLTEAQALSNLSAISRQLEQAFPATNTEIGALVEPLRERSLPGELRRAFVVFMAVVGFVLLIACVNIANLLLGRAVARDREMGVRAALGATRSSIARLLLTESLLIAGAGSLLGLLLGRVARDALIAAVPIEIPIWMRFDIDGTVVAFVMALMVVSALAFGLLPAWRAARPDLTEALKESGTRSATGATGRLRNLLVVGEVAIAVVLLIACGLAIRGFLKLLDLEPGFRPANVLTLRVGLPAAAYPNDDQRRRFVESLLPRIRGLTGVRQAALVSGLPLGGGSWTENITIEGAPAPPPGRSPEAVHTVASQGFFETLGIPLVAGRTFDERDGTPGTDPVVIVNRTLADLHWPGKDPIGKRLKYGDSASLQPWMRIIGVVGDVRQREINRPIRQAMYVPYAQFPLDEFTVLAGTGPEPLTLVEPIRRVVRDMDRKLPIWDVFTMDRVIVRSMWQPRLFSWIFTAFGLVALVLAVVGVYGVMSYSVAQRSREFGIRMALGAGRARVRAMVLRQGLVLAAVGVALGLAGALAVTRVLRALLFGVSPTDPLTFAAVTAVMVVCAIAASYVPARRATSVEPVTALRNE